MNFSVSLEENSLSTVHDSNKLNLLIEVLQLLPHGNMLVCQGIDTPHFLGTFVGEIA